MLTGQCYFYMNNNGYNENHYIVVKVNVFNNNIDEAERKVRTLVNGRKNLAGGWFTEKAIPYNFNDNYTVINCSDNMPIMPYDEADKFIIDLIEKERNMKFSLV